MTDDAHLPAHVQHLIALDDAAERLLNERLDRIDRKAPLPIETAAAVTALLVRAAPVLARVPRRFRPELPAAGAPLMPFDAFVALMQLREALLQEVETRAAAALASDPPPR
jgi:hypothetical protein